MNGIPHQSVWWSGSLTAISLIIMQSFISLNYLDVAAWISIITLAFAIPILTSNTLIKITKARRRLDVRDTMQEVLFYTTGMAVAYVGIVAAFWHISWIAGVVFFSSTLLALPTYFWSLHRKS
ncbi:MAG TPA: hypothetical protein VKV40_02250 [Ktedonobacteraceae bacterium]|nr:hypothetical protein [Ktedonobacteraceae bacterium]